MLSSRQLRCWNGVLICYHLNLCTCTRSQFLNLDSIKQWASPLNTSYNRDLKSRAQSLNRARGGERGKERNKSEKIEVWHSPRVALYQPSAASLHQIGLVCLRAEKGPISGLQLERRRATPACPRALTQQGVEEFTHRAESAFWSSNVESQPQAGLESPATNTRSVLSRAPRVTLPSTPRVAASSACHSQTRSKKIFCTHFITLFWAYKVEKRWGMKLVGMSQGWVFAWGLIVCTCSD